MNVREINQSERKDIEKFLAMDKKELYGIIPSYLAEYRGTFFSPQRRVELGKELFGAIESDLHNHLCDNWDLCDKIDHPKWNDLVCLVSTVGDIIAAKITCGIPPLVISTLLVKIGLRAFCDCDN